MSIFSMTCEVMEEREQARLAKEKTPDELIQEVIRTASRLFNVPVDMITGKSRKYDVMPVRHLAIYVSKKCFGLSFKQVGSRFGGRDHATAIHSCQTVKDLIDTANAEFIHYWNIWIERAPKYLVP